jgi:PAS domain S-box-containing protein
MALLDAQGRILWINGGFERASGFRALSVLGQPVQQVLGAHADDVPLWAAIRQAMDGTDVLELALLPWHDGAGAARWAQATLKPLGPNDQAGGACWLWVMNDISEHQRLRAEAQRTSQRLHTAQEFGRLALWDRDLPFGEGHWDPYMYRMWGISPDQPVPDFSVLAKRIHPDDRPGELYLPSTQKAGKYSKRYRLVLPSGQVRHVHAQWEVTNGNDGQPRLLTGVMVDDTEVHELAQSFNRLSTEFELAVDLAKIVIWRHDVKSDRVYWNDRAFEVLDMVPRPEGLTIAEAYTRMHPDDLGSLLAAAEKARETNRPVDQQARYLRSDGTWRTVLTRRCARRNEAGELVDFIGVALDITEQSEKNRHASELSKRLQIAAGAAGLGIWSRDPDSQHGEWNVQMFEITGRLPSLGVPTRHEWVEQIIHPDDRPRMRNANAELRATLDVPVEQEYRVLRPDGEVRWLVNRARHEQRDGKSMLFGITIDVTERKLTESALRQAHERIALAVHGAGIGTWERDLARDTVLWDEQMYGLRGLSPHTEKPSDVLRFELAHPDDIDRILRLNAEAVRERRMCTYEFRSRMPDGSFRWFASRSVTVCDDAGVPVRQIGVNWDVHERVMAEAERQEKLIAQRESHAKSEFLARMSHELRTPLNAVLGFTQLLRLSPDAVDETQRDKLGHIQSAGEHLLSLINDVLDLSSLESGQLKLDLQPVPLADVLAEAMALVESTARNLGVQLQVEPMDAVLKVDRIRTRQVLINLLSNAVKYNRSRGRVTISARPDGNQVLMRVADTGRGMTAEQLTHLFEPFNRLGMEREGIEGAGMGLAVVKALVERMGGSVDAQSEPGVGSCFEVRLPRNADEETAATGAMASVQRDDAGASPRPPGSRSGQLLYIEDNPVNVLLVEELVRGHAGLRIESRLTGIEGVERARELRPDLILIDMQLPDIHGFEVLRRLRHLPETAHIPCIALSANAMPDDIARATAAGFSDYWTKPINFKAFLSALDRLFPASR